MLTKENIQYFYGLSPLQEGMLFHYLLSPETTANIHQLSYKVAGPLDVEKFQQSWDLIMDRHDMLRTSFVYRKVKKPVQVVMKKRPVGFHYEDLRTLSEIEQNENIRQFKENDKARGFDLNKDVLLRISVLQTEDERYEIIWSYHHIILDGWCMGIIMGELLRFYDQLLRNETPESKAAISYGEYIRFLAGISKSETRQFWRNYLDGYEQQYGFPKKSIDTQGHYTYAAIRKNISAPKVAGLQHLAEQHNVTLNAVIQSIWGLLCMRYNHQQDAIFGFTVSGRNPEIHGVDEIIGLFINTIPVRLQADEQQPIGTLFKKAHREAIETQRFHHSSLADILSLTPAGSTLIDHIVVFENFPVDEKIEQEAKGLVNIVDVEIFEHTTYDLAITFIPGQLLQMRIEFNAEVYDREFIELLSEQFEQLIDQVLEQPHAPIQNLKLISAADEQALIQQDNTTAYPKTEGLASLFEQTVMAHPERDAVVLGEQKLTYAQLNLRANQLASALLTQGVKPGEVVALLLDRSTEQIASILAVLKTGAAYLPLDPNLPHERLEFMLRDSGAVVLITDQESAPDFLPLLRCAEINDELAAENPKVKHTGDDLAYIIYTSGSTGQPKGTLIAQKSVTRVVRDTNYIQLLPEDRVGGLSSYAFDGSVFDIFGALLNGATLVLIPKDIALDLTRLPALLAHKQVSVLFITTALFNTLVDEGLDALRGLRKILFGGERVSVPHVRRALDALGSDVLLHVYGPTESTVFATCYPIREVAAGAFTVPIGKALSNTQTWVLNEQRQLLPAGVPGELYLSGDGLAMAYLHQPELTKQLFVSAPFAEGLRLYKTGDLVRLLPDGNIEFIGRVDQQVKIRGFRVEPGEIETRLLEMSAIREAVVVDLEDTNGSRYLCAYLTSDQQLEVQQVLDELGKQLPEYMVPARAIQLEVLPLNANGKVDKKQLPKPDVFIDEAFEAPHNDTQEKLSLIWGEILGLERVSINDSFFRLGGHSLKAMVLASRIQQTFEAQISIGDLFAHTTIKAQEKLINGSAPQQLEAILPAPEMEHYPLSAAQRRMYFLQLFEPEQTTYNIPMVLQVSGNADLQRLSQAIRQLIQRHEALRTNFVLIDGVPVQSIVDATNFDIELLEAKHTDIKKIAAEFVRPFDLTQAPLFRVGWCAMPQGENYLLIDLHHIIADGASLPVLIRDLVNLYDGLEPEPLMIHYKDFAVWQNQYFEGSQAQNEADQWKKILADEIPVLTLPTDFKRPPVQDFKGETYRFELTAELSSQLKTLAQKHDATLFMVLMSAYQVLLSKYSGQDQIMVGTPLAGRTHADLEHIPGMFVNTLPVKGMIAPDQSFADHLKKTKAHLLEVFALQNYPFDQLIDLLHVNRDAARNPLFDVLFVFQNNEKQSLNPGEMQVSVLPFENAISKFDLTLSAAEVGDAIQLSLEFATALFLPQTIKRMSQHFIALLESVVKQPQLELGAISLLSEAEQQAQLEPSADFAAAWPQDETLLSLFEKQVQRTPDHVAVVSGEKSLTYTELNALANQLAAHILGQHNIQADDKIAILLERTEWMLVAIMAVLKTGGCYVPVDPAYPEDRQEYMISDSGAVLCINQDFLDGFLTVRNTYAPENTGVSRKPDALAYIIYTSGSTGQPKGVMIEDRQVVRLLFNERDRFDFASSDVWSMFHSYCFDFSVWEMYGALLFGGKLVVVPKAVAQSPAEFRSLVLAEGVTVLNQTPGSFYAFSEQELLTSDAELKLRYVIFGGEALNPLKLADWRKRYPQVKLINMYGITETTVHVTYKEITETEIASGVSNIGVAIPTLNILILDENQNLLPIGVAGELCVEGAGLARGYLNRDDLTQERFPAHPFKDGERIYRSGDLARWLPNGELEYLGRIDHQVKIRGFRIELGEIENALLKHPQVQSAVVLDQADAAGDRFLAAWIVPKGEMPAITDLRTHLGQSLPDYMIPAFFVPMDKIPLTGNGKVDRKALPDPKANLTTEKDYLAPRNEAEKALAEVWEQTLGVQPISIDASFFEVGGDSIKAIQIAARLTPYGFKLELRDLFRYPTIAELAPQLTQHTAVAAQETVLGSAPLTPTQAWFFDQQFEVPEHWNQSLMFWSQDGFDTSILPELFRAMCKQHDGLRQRFVISEQQWQVLYADDFDLPFEIHQLKGHADPENEITRLASNIQASLDLSQTPIKAALFQTDAGDHLLLAVHHLLMDGVSWRILLEDMKNAYQQLADGADLALPPKTSAYKHWAEFLYENKTSSDLKREASYWENLAKTPVGELNKKLGTSIPVRGSENFEFAFDEDSTSLLLKKANLAYNTQIDDLLMTALGFTLRELTGSDNNLITLEGHGRETENPDFDLTRTVGWFTSIYPVLLQVNQPEDLKATIRTVKENLRHIPAKGTNFNRLLYPNAQIPKVKPEISFNYLGQFDQDFKADGSWKISPIFPGTGVNPENHRTSVLDITGMVANQQLKFTISWHPEQISVHVVESFASLFQDFLKRIIEHCSQQQISLKSPADFDLARLSLPEFDQLMSQVTANGLQVEDLYPLTPMQEGMLFHTISEPGSGAYFEQAVFDLNGTVDPALLQQSLDTCHVHHPILRTRFVYEGLQQPHQLVFTALPADFTLIDLRKIQDDERESQLQEILTRDRQRGFDLSADTLMRLIVVHWGKDQFKVVWSHHHILMDGWCIARIIQDFVKTYASLQANGTIPTLLPTPPYRNYLQWLSKRSQEDAAAYWKTYLEGYDQVAEIPALAENNALPGIKKQVLTLSAPELAALQERCAENRVTINSWMQTLWGIVLHRYNRCADAVFGSVVSGRPPEINGVEDMIGLFINTVPVRVNNQDDVSFEQLVKQVQADQVESRSFDYYPLAAIQALTPQKRSLIQQILVFENYPVSEEVEGGQSPNAGISIQGFEMSEQTNYPLTIVFVPGNELTIKWEYQHAIFSEQQIEELSGLFMNLLHHSVKRPSQAVHAINWLSMADDQLLSLPSDFTSNSFKSWDGLYGPFYKMVDKFPDHSALVTDHHAVSFRELDLRVKQLVSGLEKHGIKPGDIVSVMLERSVEQVALMLAIWHIGAIYQPIDTHYPDDRVKFMLEDAGSKLLVRNQATNEPFSSVAIASLFGAVTEQKPHHASPDEAAYLIYTSGSTGKPKGVLVPYRGIHNSVQAMMAALHLKPDDTLTGFASIAFDASIMELLLGLLSGARVYLFSRNEIADVNTFIKQARQFEISILHLPPAYLALLDEQELPDVRLVITAGEAARPQDVTRFARKAAYFNAYGPTEASVCTTLFEVNPYHLKDGSIPIGKPLANMRTYVMDEQLRPVPSGVVGELLIAGPGVALGYLNRDDLTREKFVPDPEHSDALMYRSGDLVKRLPDGNLLFLGRIDDQVKIRGYRIEPGEIAALMTQQADVREAHVAALTAANGERYLCGWYTGSADADQLKQALAASLPEYMLPSFLIRVDEFALTSNGKIDQRALPLPNQEVTHKIMAAPFHPHEEQLHAIWKDLLLTDQFGVTDSFFDLGGHSLLVIRMLARIKETLGLSADLAVFMKQPTIRQLAQQLNSGEGGINLEDSLRRDFLALGNPEGKPLFLFPPMVGFSLLYRDLSALLENHAVYAFNYIGGHFDPVKYVQRILEIQPEGPYLLSGYSIGGNLAHHIAAELQRAGKKVSDVILIDSTFRTEAKSAGVDVLEANALEFMQQIDADTRSLVDQLGLSAMVKAKIQSYMHFALTVTDYHPVSWNVHLIRSEANHELADESASRWKQLAGNRLKIYQGKGEHTEMLVAPFLEANASLLGAILNGSAVEV